MKLRVNAGPLRDAFNNVLSVVDKKNARPILTNCRVIVRDNQVAVAATDLEVSAEVITPANVEKEGEFCINAKNISDILREMPDEEMTLAINSEENTLKLECGKINYSLLIFESTDFPPLTFKTEEKPFDLEATHISNIINKASHAISTDETRLFLNGIFLKYMDGCLRSVAIDGHRLALVDTTEFTENNASLNEGIIIPRKGVNELKKIADSAKDQNLLFYVNDSYLCVNSGDSHFLSIRLISREYPNYEAVIPKQSSYELTVDKNSFLTAIKRIKILAAEKSNGIKLNLSEGALTLSANHPSFGDAKESISVDYAGKEMSIGFNAKYLMDAFSVMEGEEVQFSFNNELSPILLKSKATTDFLGIIMPLKL